MQRQSAMLQRVGDLLERHHVSRRVTRGILSRAVPGAVAGASCVPDWGKLCWTIPPPVSACFWPWQTEDVFIDQHLLCELWSTNLLRCCE
jgi:hypothetical protein